jgi:hypothetical protein
VGQFDGPRLQEIADVSAYVGSAIHKRFPGDYGFQPPTNPRRWKSLCDGKGVIVLEQAQYLLRTGIMKGLISTYFDGELPKFVWSVAQDGRPFEAKIGLGGYHGYVLESDDDMAHRVVQEWKMR